MNEENLPIDIHCNKLLDWLVSRRHCQQQWQSSVLTIREKINAAIQDMPLVEEITKLLRGTYINYFHCLKIVELLKGTDDGAKNIFGGYSSKRMKDWQEILKLYEKDGVFIAEASQLLMRNVNYEIPSLKKQIAKCRQMQADCTRKESDYSSSASQLREKYKQSCQEMGIEGKKVRKELLELVKDMPSTYDRIARNAKDLKPACDYYLAFVSFTLKNEGLADESCLLLRHIMEKGNTTVYEWRKGEAPVEVEAIPFDLSIRLEDDEEEKQEQIEVSEEIDWGQLDSVEDVIDFDISVEDGGQESENAIDFNIDGGGIEVNGDLDASVATEITPISITEKEGVARGEDALTLLDNGSTRDHFMDDVMELESFLHQRLVEMELSDDVLMSSQFHSAPKILQPSTSQLQSMLDAVTVVRNAICNKRMEDLLMIRSSIRYVDRLAESLKKILDDSERAMSMSRLMAIQRKEALEEQALIEPKLDLIRGRTKELQKQIEEEISKKYKGRRVNIMGEINTV